MITENEVIEKIISKPDGYAYRWSKHILESDCDFFLSKLKEHHNSGTFEDYGINIMFNKDFTAVKILIYDKELYEKVQKMINPLCKVPFICRTKINTEIIQDEF